MKNISALFDFVKPLKPKKQGSLRMARTYSKTDLPYKDKVAKALRECGKKLIFAEYPDGETELIWALFCQQRLCPMCAWRRSIRASANIKAIIEEPEFRDLEFIFLTLTIKNCAGHDLDMWLDRILAAWRILTSDKRKPFRKSFLGTFRGLEITYNKKEDSYHPHFHVMAAVPKAYFKKNNKDYISHDRLKKIWTDALNRAVQIVPGETVFCNLDCKTWGVRLDLADNVKVITKNIRKKYPSIDFDPWVHIEKVTTDTSAGIAEVAKYAVKVADIVDLPKVVEVLDPALRHRRLIAYGGLFKEVRDRLQLEDENVAASDVSRQTIEQILRDPRIRKIALDWFFGAQLYKVVPFTGIPQDGGGNPRNQKNIKKDLT